MDIFEFAAESRKGKKEVSKNEPKKTRTIQFIHYKKLNPCKENDVIYSNSPRFRDDSIIHLAESIRISGEIKEPLIIRKTNIGEYEIISGHRRRLASIYLVEHEHLDKFALLPCIVDNASDTMSRFNLIITNATQGERSDSDKYNEVKKLTGIINELVESGEIDKVNAREMRAFLSDKLNISQTKVAQYQNIEHNLESGIMQEFEAGNIGVSVANEMAGLPANEQKQLFESKGRDIKLSDVKAVKETKDNAGIVDEPEREICGVCLHNGDCVEKKTYDTGCMGYEPEKCEDCKEGDKTDGQMYNGEQAEIVSEAEEMCDETHEADDVPADDRHKKDRVMSRPMTDEEIENYENIVSHSKQGVLEAVSDDDVTDKNEAEELIKKYIDYAKDYFEEKDYENCHFYLLNAVKKLSEEFYCNKENPECWD